MRKHDLVHLHTLLACCRRFVADREPEQPGAYDAYEALGVSPTGLTRQKDAHEKAVFALLDGLEATVSDAEHEETADRVEPGAGHAD
jgi:hypothetical protein